MTLAEETKAIKFFVKLLGCDSARIATPMGKLFLIIGTRRNTKSSPGQWYRNGKAIDCNYTEERCIASGSDLNELTRSARQYKRLREWKNWPTARQIRTLGAMLEAKTDVRLSRKVISIRKKESA